MKERTGGHWRAHGGCWKMRKGTGGLWGMREAVSVSYVCEVWGLEPGLEPQLQASSKSVSVNLLSTASIALTGQGEAERERRVMWAA